MCVKFPLGNLNPDSCPPYPTSTYICGMIITLIMCGGEVDT